MCYNVLKSSVVFQLLSEEFWLGCELQSIESKWDSFMVYRRKVLIISNFLAIFNLD